MMVRAEQQAIMLWNKKNGRTGYVNGPELRVLSDWVHSGQPHAFIQKLEQLSLLPENRQELSDALVLCQQIQSPPRAWIAPESLHIELTSSCPLNCPQCYKHLDKQALDFQFLCRLIAQAGEMKVFQLALGGGEPLLYPGLAQAIHMAEKHGMSTSITTSGATLTKSRLQQLINAGLSHIQISLNGSTKEVHGLSRDGFAIGMKALALLRQVSGKSPVSYGINWVARKDNLHDWESLAVLAQQYQCNNINVLRYKPSQTENFEACSLSQEESYQLAEKISHVKGIRINVDSAYSNLLCYLNRQTSFMAGCGAGRRFIAVNVQGEFMPCSHMPLRAKSGSLKEFWFDSELLGAFRRVEETVKAPCQACQYLKSCRGCRAIAEKCNDFHAGDQNCFLIKEGNGQVIMQNNNTGGHSLLLKR